MKKRIKINGWIIFAVLSLIAFFPKLFLRNESSTGYEIMGMLGVASMLFGQILRVSSRGYKSEHSKNGNSLAVNGPYTMVRNPMYLGIFLMGLGISLMLFQWWVISLFVAVFVLRYLLLIYKEEKKLEQIFGKEYSDYKKRVPRILPSLNTLFKRDVREYLPMKLSWLKKEIGSIVAVLSGVLLLLFWQGLRNKEMAIFFKELISIIIFVSLFIAFIIYLNRLNKNETDQS